ncbi:hypothetical protein ELI15_14000 [Rhizobium ruizarguesonis]|uniref:hypothetical protein n=1 Tax=Rhizobium ruizarguesonis TaxID=2081791 RepID=UPI001030B0E6|nr:hypothetical protein [Rhizobium ruizarguesonis]TAW65402.1 hypothetical protein ELI15_14000 [Rhizobium ruizarguesonis]
MPLPEGFDRDAFIAQLRVKHMRILAPGIEFAVEDGWLPLIADSLHKIELSLELHGWAKKAVVKQIKEKMGDLRIYVRPRRESASYPDALVRDLEIIRNLVTQGSRLTCEICSDPGRIDSFAGYFQCLCPRHAEQRRGWIAGGRKGDIFDV